MTARGSRWWFSLLLLFVYVAIFLAWRQFPSRESFLFVGFASAALLATSMVAAAKHGYFVNRTDFVLHALVILDIVLETVAFELFLPVVVWAGIVSDAELAAGSLVRDFHDNNNFYFCALAFAVIIGLYRARVMSRQSKDNRVASA